MITTDRFEIFRNLVSTRYSCRKYSEQDVSREDITAILETARLAPSACNRQPWRFIILDTPQNRAIAHNAYPREWIKPVKTFIIACGNHNEAWHRGDGKDHTDVDVSIAVEHICLAATALGLGSCWICNFDAEVLSQQLNLPDGLEPIAIIPIGYPADGETVAEKKRQSIQEIVQWGVD